MNLHRPRIGPGDSGARHRTGNGDGGDSLLVQICCCGSSAGTELGCAGTQDYETPGDGLLEPSGIRT
jgi:hypothetical protein